MASLEDYLESSRPKANSQLKAPKKAGAKKMAKKASKKKSVAKAKKASPKKTVTKVVTVAAPKPRRKRKAKKAAATVSLYRGRRSGKNLSLHRLSGFDMKSLEKFIQPVGLILGGALGWKLVDKKFLSSMLTGEGIAGKYSEQIKAALAIAVGLGVAVVGKKDWAKYVGMGIAGIQGVDLVANTLAKGLFASGGAARVGGVARIGGVARTISGVGNTVPHTPWDRPRNYPANNNKTRSISGVAKAASTSGIHNDFPV